MNKPDPRGMELLMAKVRAHKKQAPRYRKGDTVAELANRKGVFKTEDGKDFRLVFRTCLWVVGETENFKHASFPIGVGLAIPSSDTAVSEVHDAAITDGWTLLATTGDKPMRVDWSASEIGGVVNGRVNGEVVVTLYEGKRPGLHSFQIKSGVEGNRHKEISDQARRKLKDLWG